MQHALTSTDGVANVVLFAGPAFVPSLWLRRPMITAAGLSVVSALIELMQAGFAGTSCQPADWMANAAGAVAGFVLAATALAARDRHRTTLRPWQDRWH